MMKTVKVKGEGRQSQVSFILYYYYIVLMQHASALSTQKPSSDKIKVPNTSYFVNYIVHVGIYSSDLKYTYEQRSSVVYMITVNSPNDDFSY
jgi:hypothetical protein